MNLRPPGYEPDELPTALSRDMVPETGIEPARDRSHGILSPGRLPIPPLRHRVWLPICSLKAKIVYHRFESLSSTKNSRFFGCAGNIFSSVYKNRHISRPTTHILIRISSLDRRNGYGRTQDPDFGAAAPARCTG